MISCAHIFFPGGDAMGDGWETYLIYFMLGVFPWIFVAVGAWMIWSAHKFMQKAVRTRGTVVEVHRKTSTTSRDDSTRTVTTFQPVFEYQGEDGSTKRGLTWMASTSYNYAIGSEHEILVNPDDETVRVPGFMIYGFGAIFGGIGLVVGIVGIFAIGAM